MTLQELYKTNGTWTQRAFARDHSGRCVLITEPQAKSFCLEGALVRCYPNDDEYTKTRFRLMNVVCPKGYPYISAYNDAPSRRIKDICEVVKLAKV